jgi:Fe-S-cluster containining protein
MSTFCLSLHAGYACRHSGECCTNWTVPAEPHVVELVARRGIRPRGLKGPLFVSAEAAVGGTQLTVARDTDGSCVFFESRGGRLCAIHRAAGPNALPTACRHFPRVVLRDDRGTFVSLSHFCPTAAAMLVTERPVEIVSGGGSLMLDEPVEGLDATGALPPLVRPGVLSDLEGYGAWERACLAVFARPELSVEEALEEVAGATERVRSWRPADGSLHATVMAAFADAHAPHDRDAAAHDRIMNTIRPLCAGAARDAIEPIADFERQWQRLAEPSMALFDLPLKNYLAARLFGNWIAYQGRGLRSVVEWLRTCAAAVRQYVLRAALSTNTSPTRADLLHAIRMADLLLLHGIDTAAFARQAMTLEGPDPR